MSEITETEIKSMTKKQNYMRGYRDGKSDVLDKLGAEIMSLTNDDTPERIWNVDVLEIIDKYKNDESSEFAEIALKVLRKEQVYKENIQNQMRILQDLWKDHGTPEITTNRVSEVYRDFCKQELTSWQEIEGDLIRADSHDLVQAIGKSTSINITRYKKKLHELDDVRVQLFDELLLGKESELKEKCDDDLYAKLLDLKEYPTGIYIDLLAFNDFLHITDYQLVQETN